MSDNIHIIDSDIAIKVGSKAAALFCNAILPLLKDKNLTKKIGKKVWLTVPVTQMQKIVCYLTDSEIRYCLRKLVNAGILEKKSISTNECSYAVK